MGELHHEALAVLTWPRIRQAMIATANPLSVAHSGVRVFSRAKNAGDNALTST